MIAKLNAKQVENLKPKPGQRIELHDTEVRGLSLRVSAAGVKSWSVMYRNADGARKRFTIGTLDQYSLAEARDRARDELRRVAKGGDPAAEKRTRRKAETVADLATDFIERYAKKRKRSWKHDDWMLRAKVLPAWKDRKIANITRRDVRLLVQGIADGGAPILANRSVALLSKLFRFALDEELIETSPAVAIGRPAPDHQRDRVLTEDEIRAVWTTCDSFPSPMGAYYQLRLVTAQRGAEVAAMRWQDVDLESAWWTVPGEVVKNKLTHRVPLSILALDILKTLRATAAGETTYVLDGARGKRQQSEAAAHFTVPDFRPHDLRRTAASLMAGGGIPRLTIAKILNHVERDITAVYDRHSYDAEKRAALEWWSAKLAAILEPHKASRVLPFARTGA